MVLVDPLDLCLNIFYVNHRLWLPKFELMLDDWTKKIALFCVNPKTIFEVVSIWWQTSFTQARSSEKLKTANKVNNCFFLLLLFSRGEHSMQ